MFNNIEVAIADAEGVVTRVEKAKSKGFTKDTTQLSNTLSSLFTPNEPGYKKVYLTIKANDEKQTIRRDLARDEDTPASIILELMEYDKTKSLPQELLNDAHTLAHYMTLESLENELEDTDNTETDARVISKAIELLEG